MYEVIFKIDGIEHRKTLNAGSEDEAYYTISGLYPTKQVDIVKVRKIEM